MEIMKEQLLSLEKKYESDLILPTKEVIVWQSRNAKQREIDVVRGEIFNYSQVNVQGDLVLDIPINTLDKVIFSQKAHVDTGSGMTWLQVYRYRQHKKH